MPEPFPKLKVIRVESEVAWAACLMQRLDSEYKMRTSECAALKRPPREYMREMPCSSPPLEVLANPEALKMNFEMICAETHLLYASDYPPWHMDLPSVIDDLPFLGEKARRNISGDTARRLFNLDVSARVPSAGTRARPPQP